VWRKKSEGKALQGQIKKQKFQSKLSGQSQGGCSIKTQSGWGWEIAQGFCLFLSQQTRSYLPATGREKTEKIVIDVSSQFIVCLLNAECCADRFQMFWPRFPQILGKRGFLPYLKKIIQRRWDEFKLSHITPHPKRVYIYICIYIYIYIFFVCVCVWWWLGMKPKSSNMLGKHSDTELYSYPYIHIIYTYVYILYTFIQIAYIHIIKMYIFICKCTLYK
jgi:hypothetical protein